MTAPAAYVPTAIAIVSPAAAWLTAYWIVAQGVAGLVQAPVSTEPASST